MQPKAVSPLVGRFPVFFFLFHLLFLCIAQKKKEQHQVPEFICSKLWSRSAVTNWRLNGSLASRHGRQKANRYCVECGASLFKSIKHGQILKRAQYGFRLFSANGAFSPVAKKLWVEANGAPQTPECDR